MDFLEHFLLQAAFSASTMPSSFNTMVKEQVHPLSLTSLKVSRRSEAEEEKAKVERKRQSCHKCPWNLISQAGLVDIFIY